MAVASNCIRKVPPSERNASPSRNEGFIFPKKLEHQGLSTFVQKKGDCYPELVGVLYNNIKVVDGNIHSRVKGVDIIINNDTWLQVTGLKDEGRMSHLPDSQQNRWTKKTKMFKDCMRYSGRYKKEKGFLLRWLDKEEKIIAYIIDWVLLPRRFHYDKLTIEDLYLLNAIMFRIPTNWVAVFKKHIIDVGNNNGCNLPYVVLTQKAFQEGRKLENKCAKVAQDRELEEEVAGTNSTAFHYINSSWLLQEIKLSFIEEEEL
ncbi:hypothetical protein LR48_Vigan11g062400 [Vigna angularis]|uniref:Uncharacterized protein n=1 Tax=Phaseolus angularis TaxID=3914 RepID=A0A0L9VR92_PHAAN|nr:hypothetical protein LR48_Vigan11g062400 [Vigna angularis]